MVTKIDVAGGVRGNCKGNATAEIGWGTPSNTSRSSVRSSLPYDTVDVREITGMVNIGETENENPPRWVCTLHRVGFAF